MNRLILTMAGSAALLSACATPMAERSDLVAESSACGPQRFEVYFAEGEATLTPAAQAAISLTSTQLQPCEVTRVQVLGLASATGAAGSNQDLSERRAITVAQALEAAGWPAAQFEVGAAGDQGAQVTGTVAEPMRRRTEVLIEARPR